MTTELRTLTNEYLVNLADAKNLNAATIQSYRHDLAVFVDWLENQDINDWHQVDQNTLLAWLTEQTQAKATIRRHLLSLQRFFRYWQSRSVLDDNPVDLVELPVNDVTNPDQPLTKAEMERLLGRIKLTEFSQVRTRLMIELLYSTGMRVSELCKLKVSDFQFDLQTIQLSDRVVLYDDQTAMVLRWYLMDLQPQADQHLFERTPKQPFSRQLIWQLIRQAGTEAGFDNVSPRRIRQSFIARLTENGAPLTLIQTLLGRHV